METLSLKVRSNQLEFQSRLMWTLNVLHSQHLHFFMCEMKIKICSPSMKISLMMHTIFKCQMIRIVSRMLQMREFFSKMICDKRWGSLPAKLCYTAFWKDTLITNDFSLFHLLSSCSFVCESLQGQQRMPWFFRSVFIRHNSSL